MHRIKSLTRYHWIGSLRSELLLYTIADLLIADRLHYEPFLVLIRESVTFPLQESQMHLINLSKRLMHYGTKTIDCSLLVQNKKYHFSTC